MAEKKITPIVEWDNWKGGVVTLVSDSKLKQNQAKEALNLWLVEDGIWQTRPGSDKYTTDLGSTIDGWYDYIKSDGTHELIAVGDDLVRRFASGSWTTISGMTPTAGLPCGLIQFNAYLYIYNGTDDLGRYDGSTLGSYTLMSAPAWGGTPLARAVLTSGNYNYYYRITASNEVGETTANAEQTIGVNKDRDLWNGTSEGITLAWAAVSGADRYTIYFSDLSGYERKLADVDGALTSWTDFGTATVNDFIPTPSLNLTDGPKFKYATTSKGRLWATGDPGNIYRVYWTGTDVGEQGGAFNWYNDGGFVDLDYGDGNANMGLVEFQGDIYIFKENSIYRVYLEYSSVYGTNVPVVERIIVGVGCSSHRAIVKVENDVFFLSSRGIFVLGNEPNVVSDVLRTNELSAAVRPYIKGINQANISKANAYYEDSKVYFCVPYGDTKPSRTIIYDREHGCWIKDWSIGFSQLGSYTDSNNVKRFIGSSNTDGFLDEISENYKGDRGVAFSTKFTTNKVDFGSWSDFTKLRKAMVRMRNPRGSISLEILGTTKNSSFSSIKSSTITPAASEVGVGYELMGDFMLGDADGDVGAYDDTDLIRWTRVNKRLRDCQVSISTDGIDDYYTLLAIKVEGLPLKTATPSTWKVS